MAYSKLGFEISECGRCGGTGHFSFNLRDGTMCYGCGGTGFKYTKKGSAANTFFQESLLRPVSEVVVGDLVKNNITRRWKEVIGISPDDLNEGHVIIDLSTMPDNKGYSWHVGIDARIKSIKDSKDFQDKLLEAVRLQTRLTKSGKLMKKYEK